METIASKIDTFEEDLLGFIQEDISRIRCNDEIQRETVLGTVDAKVLSIDSRYTDKSGWTFAHRPTTNKIIKVEEVSKPKEETFWYIYRKENNDN